MPRVATFHLGDRFERSGDRCSLLDQVRFRERLDYVTPPMGSISMAALEKFTAGVSPDQHAAPLNGGPEPGTAGVRASESQESISYAVPPPGAYRLFVRVKRNGRVMTAAFDADVRDSGR